MYEVRDNGTHALCCDTPECHMELLGINANELTEDANLAGWTKGVVAAQEVHVCPDCTRGTHPGGALLPRNARAIAPAAVKKGDPLVDPNGDVVGHYTEDGQQGQPVPIELKMPDVKPPVPSARYADMLGEDAQSVVAPAGPPPVPRSLSAAAGSHGGSGIVTASADRPSDSEIARASAKAPAKARGPQLNEEKIEETRNLFGFLDDDTAWVPDDK